MYIVQCGTVRHVVCIYVYYSEALSIEREYGVRHSYRIWTFLTCTTFFIVGDQKKEEELVLLIRIRIPNYLVLSIIFNNFQINSDINYRQTEMSKNTFSNRFSNKLNCLQWYEE